MRSPSSNETCFGAEQTTIEARETTKRCGKHYCDTLVELYRALAGNPTASNRADQVLIQSLEE